MVYLVETNNRIINGKNFSKKNYCILPMSGDEQNKY